MENWYFRGRRIEMTQATNFLSCHEGPHVHIADAICACYMRRLYHDPLTNHHESKACLLVIPYFYV
jgi:hypothetical protein